MENWEAENEKTKDKLHGVPVPVSLFSTLFRMKHIVMTKVNQRGDRVSYIKRENLPNDLLRIILRLYKVCDKLLRSYIYVICAQISVEIFKIVNVPSNFNDMNFYILQLEASLFNVIRVRFSACQ